MNSDKCEKLVDGLVKKSYPLLKDKKIHVYKFKNKKFRALAVHFLPFFRFILMHPYEMKESKTLLIGLLSHELCHLEKSEKQGWLKSTLSKFKYWTDKKIFEKGEKDTDRCAIHKGYGRELYEVAKTRPIRIKGYEQYYLTAPAADRFYGFLAFRARCSSMPDRLEM